MDKPQIGRPSKLLNHPFLASPSSFQNSQPHTYIFKFAAHGIWKKKPKLTKDKSSKFNTPASDFCFEQEEIVSFLSQGGQGNKLSWIKLTNKN